MIVMLKIKYLFIVISHNNSWEPATVIKVDIKRPRSYVLKLLKTEIGLKRNRKFLENMYNNK